jgi:biopolymer transport protein ExbD
MSSQPARVDVPKESVTDSPSTDEVFMLVQVTVDDKYIIDDKEYLFSEISTQVDYRINTRSTSNRTLKIEGEKMAHYDPIFKLMALAQINGLEPVLAYTKQ